MMLLWKQMIMVVIMRHWTSGSYQVQFSVVSEEKETDKQADKELETETEKQKEIDREK